MSPAALYVDASAAAKLFVKEAGSEVASKAIGDADVLIGSRVLYTEVAAAVYRRLDGSDRVEALDEWERLWPDFDVVELDARLGEHALGLAQFHGLGTLDAIHLASALRLPALPMHFATWDLALSAAARAAGLRTLPAFDSGS